jgi:hypothetical protein
VTVGKGKTKETKRKRTRGKRKNEWAKVNDSLLNLVASLLELEAFRQDGSFIFRLLRLYQTHDRYIS